MRINARPLLAFSLATALGLSLSACNGGLSNVVSGVTGGKAQVRLLNASPQTTTPLSLSVANTTINSGITNATPVGVYSSVNTGNQTFAIVPSTVTAVSKTLSPSTFYTVVLLGEPGQPNYGEFIFQDTNSIQSPGTVRYKVNDASPQAGPVDFYLYQGSTLPTTPSVGGLTVGTDSGSISNPPGNSYIPTLGSSTLLPSGVYKVAVTAAGNPSLMIFTGTASLTVNHSYSFTITDNAAGMAGHANVIAAIDQPAPATNQGNLMH